MPFDPDAYLAKKNKPFDPDAYLEQKGMELATKAADTHKDEYDVSPLASAVGGAAQGVSLNYADEIYGGGKAAAQTLFGDAKLEDIGDTYAAGRDEARHGFNQLKAANPKSFTGGEIGGGLASLAVPGLNVAKGAKLSAAAAKMAGVGAIEGLGRSEADTLGGLATDTLVSGAIGGALPVVGKGVGSVVDKVKGRVSSTLKGVATSQRAKAIRKTAGEATDELKSEVLRTKNANIIKTGEKYEVFRGNADSIIPKIQVGKSKVGQELGNIAQESADRLGPLVRHTNAPLMAKAEREFGKLAEDTTTKFNKLSMSGEDFKRVSGQLQTDSAAILKQIEASPNPLATIRELKTNVQERLSSADFAKGTKTGTEKDMLKSIAAKLKGLETSAVKSYALLLKRSGQITNEQSTKFVAKHAENLADYSNLLKLEDQVAKTLARQSKVGVGGIYSGGITGAIAGPVAGMVIGGQQAARSYLNTPKGRLLFAKAIEAIQKKASPEVLNGIAQEMNIPYRELMALMKVSGAMRDQK